MRNFWMLCAPALLAGCAVTPQQMAERARNVSDLDLCDGVYSAPYQYSGVLNAEVARRGLNCRQYQSEILARQQMRVAQEQAKAASLAATAQIIRAMQPPPTTTCMSSRFGNSIQTTCN